MKLVIFLLVSAVAVTSAQNIAFGRCPNVTTTKYIDMSKMLGRWYESRRYFTVFENAKCVKHVFYNALNLGQLLITKTTDYLTGVETWSYGVEFMWGNGTGNMIVVYPQYAYMTGNIPVPIPYNIVDTDYNNYFIGYYCVDLLLFHFKFAWILTRTASPSQAILDTALARFDSYGLDKKPLLTTSHSGCPWFH